MKTIRIKDKVKLAGTIFAMLLAGNINKIV
jgi:hypothetical protein